LGIGAGLGRYIGGLVPDAPISAGVEIHPLRTVSWVAGLEQRLSTAASIAVYDSGVRADASYSTDSGGAHIGFGYPASPNAPNPTTHEVTGVVSWQAWSIEGRGSMQWNTQVSWLRRTPFPGSAGPAFADEILFLTQLRYNLP